MKLRQPILFTAAGALTGFLYYRFFGCSNGCSITSSPDRTIIYMGLVGLLLSGIFQKPPKKEKEL